MTSSFGGKESLAREKYFWTRMLQPWKWGSVNSTLVKMPKYSSHRAKETCQAEVCWISIFLQTYHEIWSPFSELLLELSICENCSNWSSEGSMCLSIWRCWYLNTLFFSENGQKFHVPFATTKFWLLEIHREVAHLHSNTESLLLKLLTSA